ncbi:MAG: stage II sporulation protein E [Candidatus Paraimprobicoccus trichonymphae]|uniref:Stage II sporulation protein E n=1 Tax=Candidatus Paraimprobicoccus trichonymphae TaxID=3033793 RepID=A0AA48IBU2_9FIRM|nr:MAG: stage II sporulation protein E [Candidatus Paraimprobicoccus trichonymphae]
MKLLALGKKDFSLGKSDKLVRIAITNLGYFLFSILASKCPMFENYFPFGIALIVSVPKCRLISNLIGVILGYMFQIHTSASVRYISTVIAIICIDWTLKGLKNFRKNDFYIPIVVFVPTFITGLTLNSIVDGFEFNDIIASFLEALFASISAYFFNNSFKFMTENLNKFSKKDLVCISSSLSLFTLFLLQINIFNISLGRIISGFVILTLSHSIGIFGGCISGISLGIISGMYTSNLYALCGLLSGLASDFGKIGVILGFFIPNLIVNLKYSNINNIYEILISIIIFCFVPKEITDKIKNMFNNKNFKLDVLKKSVIQKLSFASNSLISMSDFVKQVSNKLSEVEIPETKNICNDTVNSVCSNCSSKNLCWNQEKDFTKQSFNEITKIISCKSSINEHNLPERFTKKCFKSREILNSVQVNYNKFLAKTEINNKLKEFRSIVSEQFNSMGLLLDDISKNFDVNEFFDQELALKIENKLNELNIPNKDVICKINNFKKIMIYIEILDVTKNIDKKIIKEISEVCEKKLELATVSVVNNRKIVQIIEKTKFTVKFGISQHNCNNGKFCGDSCSYFYDASGNFNFILSDGMGTGGRAAVDGVMTCELISNLLKSGISFDLAIKIVNSALLVKSSEESLATLDVLKLNLFTGKTEFMKAGAPFSFVKKSNNIKKLGLDSLPIGILINANYIQEDAGELGEDDWILMSSDGATDILEEKYIKESFKSWKNTDPNELSKLILDSAVSSRENLENCKDDDITVVSFKISKNIE